MYSEQELAVLYEKLDTSDALIKKLKRKYAETWRLVLAELLLLYADMGDNPSLQSVDYKLPLVLSQIDQKLDKQYTDIETILFIHLSVIYARVLKDTSSPVKDIDSVVIENIVNKTWAKDGKPLRNRMIQYKDNVKRSIRTEIYKQLTVGNIQKDAVKGIQSEFSQNFIDLDRVSRTETNRLINEAFRQSFESLGYTKYTYSAILDSRTSSICRSLNGSEYAFSDAQIGVNYPPMHPNCRSFVVPVEYSKTENTL